MLFPRSHRDHAHNSGSSLARPVQGSDRESVQTMSKETLLSECYLCLAEQTEDKTRVCFWDS